MIKIPYEVMAYQVELLYAKSFDVEADADKHCHFIAEFIRACGWDEQEYMDRWLQEQEKMHPIRPQAQPSMMS